MLKESTCFLFLSFSPLLGKVADYVFIYFWELTLLDSLKLILQLDIATLANMARVAISSNNNC